MKVVNDYLEREQELDIEEVRRRSRLTVAGGLKDAEDMTGGWPSRFRCWTLRTARKSL